MKRKNGLLAVGALAAMLAGFGVHAACAADAPAAQQPAVDSKDAERAEVLVTKALAFLKARQNEDGSWQAQGEPPGISAIVFKAFVQDPNHNLKEPFLAKGVGKLRTYQNPDGSVSDSLVTYNTAIMVSAMAASGDPSMKDAIDKAVTYLRDSQWTDKIQGFNDKDPKFGGWGYGKKSRPDLSNVQIATDALHDAGLKSDDPAFQAALKFVTRAQNNSETNDQPWAGNDGTFVYTPADGGASAAGEAFTPEGKRTLRGYGSMTYAGLKSMLYAGLSKEDPRVKAAWKWVRANWTLDNNPGLQGANPRAADSGLFYYYHTLARALRAYGEPVITDTKGAKHDWRLELIAKLESTQNPDGSWTGTQRWMESRPVLSTTFGILSLQEAIADLKEHPAQ